MYYQHRCQSPVKTTCSFFPLSRGQLLCIGHCKTYAKIGSSQMSLADCWTARPVLKLPSSLALFFTCLPSLANDEFQIFAPPNPQTSPLSSAHPHQPYYLTLHQWSFWFWLCQEFHHPCPQFHPPSLSEAPSQYYDCFHHCPILKHPDTTSICYWGWCFYLWGRSSTFTIPWHSSKTTSLYILCNKLSITVSSWPSKWA